jgi:hypothetical protein
MSLRLAGKVGVVISGIYEFAALEEVTLEHSGLRQGCPSALFPMRARS